MPTPCPICEDSGLRIVERPDGSRAAQECSCRAEKRATKKLAGARIPERYQHCTLDDYDTKFRGANKSLQSAKLMARNFVDKYPIETYGNGLMFVGTVGVGKTHLAVSVLRELIGKGVNGLFWDYRDLTKTIQHTYNRNVAETEKDVLRPIFEAEVLVLDELGANKVTDWEWDTVAHILNTRYNNQRATIITTNYANAPAAKTSDDHSESYRKNAQMAVREPSLGDRIGDRMLSRLQEMCVIVDMIGGDFRSSVKRARFGYQDLAQHEMLIEDRPHRPSFARQEVEVVGRDRMGSRKAVHQPPQKPDNWMG